MIPTSPEFRENREEGIRIRQLEIKTLALLLMEIKKEKETRLDALKLWLGMLILDLWPSQTCPVLWSLELGRCKPHGPQKDKMHFLCRVIDRKEERRDRDRKESEKERAISCSSSQITYQITPLCPWDKWKSDRACHIVETGGSPKGGSHPDVDKLTHIMRGFLCLKDLNTTKMSLRLAVCSWLLVLFS